MKGKKKTHTIGNKVRKISGRKLKTYQLAITELEDILLVTPARFLCQQRNKDLERIYALSKVKHVLPSQTISRT